MNLINRLFNKSVDCPRCLGKGVVDESDIARLDRELKWKPGACAYCNGRKVVSSGMISRINADSTYLTISISREERKRLINGDSGAVQRARLHEAQTDDFIRQIEYLYFACGLSANKIANFYLLAEAELSNSLTDKDDLLDYVERVIERKMRKDKS